MSTFLYQSDATGTRRGNLGEVEVLAYLDKMTSCSVMACGVASRRIIRTLLRFGYPADKIKWYRGGMQNWSNLRLTTVK